MDFLNIVVSFFDLIQKSGLSFMQKAMPVSNSLYCEKNASIYFGFMPATFFPVLIFMVISFSSCMDEQGQMVPVSIEIISTTPLTKEPADQMPGFIKQILAPLECEIRDFVYIPQVKVLRLDLSDENFFEIKVPKETANRWRAKFGTYGYDNLKSDYATYLPYLKAGEYLSKPGLDSLITLPDTNSDIEQIMVYELSRANIDSEVDSIIGVLRTFLCGGDKPSDVKIRFILLPLKTKIQADSAEVISLPEEIRGKTEEALLIRNDEERRKKLLEIYEAYKDTDTSSFEVYYQLAMNRVFADDENRALSCFKEAARLAISEQKGQDLLDQIQQEEEGQEKSKVQVVTVYKEWDLLQEALENGDVKILIQINPDKPQKAKKRHRHKKKLPKVDMDTQKEEKVDEYQKY